MSKHEPETPLPWVSIPTDTDYDGEDEPCGEVVSEGDAKFIVHACNAHPKLVGLVDELAKALEEEVHCSQPPAFGSKDDIAIRDLLERAKEAIL